MAAVGWAASRSAFFQWDILRNVRFITTWGRAPFKLACTAFTEATHANEDGSCLLMDCILAPSFLVRDTELMRALAVEERGAYTGADSVRLVLVTHVPSDATQPRRHQALFLQCLEHPSATATRVRYGFKAIVCAAQPLDSLRATLLPHLASAWLARTLGGAWRNAGTDAQLALPPARALMPLAIQPVLEGGFESPGGVVLHGSAFAALTSPQGRMMLAGARARDTAVPFLFIALQFGIPETAASVAASVAPAALWVAHAMVEGGAAVDGVQQRPSAETNRWRAEAAPLAVGAPGGGASRADGHRV